MKPNLLLPLSMAVTIFITLNARGTVGQSGDGEVFKESSVQSRLLSIPLHFEKNEGQTDATVKYLSRGKGYALFLTANEAVLRLSSPPAKKQIMSDGSQAGSNLQTPPASVLRLRLIGANSEPGTIGLAQSAGKVNYFKGSDPAQWRTDVPTYGQVKYQHIYPGIDLVFYGNSQQELEYDFVVAPGADPNQIRLGFTGADNIEIADNGDLVFHIGDRQIRQRKPRIYQLVNGREQEIAGSYTLHHDLVPGATDQVLVAFSLSDHDTNLPLIIDPVLTYSTYLGGSGTDAGTGIAVDTNGYAYVVGWTDSPDFPTNNAIDGGLVGPFDRDAFVVKLNPAGSGFVYATYLGGSSGEFGNAIAVDGDGNAYVVGETGSSDFPTVNAFQSTFTGSDAFLAKLNTDGSQLLYSTKLGGAAGYQQGSALAAASNGIVWIAGTTSSPNFPTRNAL